MITVVSGLPRAGTSMMMQMLRAGGLMVLDDPTRPPDESNPRGYCEDARVKRLMLDAAWIGEAEDHALKVVAPLLPYLPIDRTYRILFMLRDLDEVLASQGRMLTRMGRPASDPVLLRAAFGAQLGRARAWVAACPGAALCEVAYSDVVADPHAHASWIATFLGLPLDVAAMAKAVNVRLYRERR